MTKLALELRGLSKSYTQGDVKLDILTDCDLKIKAGELVALVAPSGTGKSTMLHLSGLLESCDKGQILVDGEDTTDLSEKKRTFMRSTKIGFIYQFHHLLPDFDAVENVAIPQLIMGRSMKEARSRASEILAFLGLAERFSHLPSQLSGGEQQRVAIARAIVNSPSLLLADEPTGNLDPKVSDTVFKGLIELARASGLGGVIATHNHEFAKYLDRTISIHNGKLVAIPS